MAFTSAPASRHNWMDATACASVFLRPVVSSSLVPSPAAAMTGVMPNLVVSLGSAPLASSTLITSLSPALAARDKGGGRLHQHPAAPTAALTRGEQQRSEASQGHPFLARFLGDLPLPVPCHLARIDVGAVRDQLLRHLGMRL